VWCNKEPDIIKKRQTFDLGGGFWKNEELLRHGQLSSKQCSDLKEI